MSPQLQELREGVREIRDDIRNLGGADLLRSVLSIFGRLDGLVVLNALLPEGSLTVFGRTALPALLVAQLDVVCSLVEADMERQEHQEGPGAERCCVDPQTAVDQARATINDVAALLQVARKKRYCDKRLRDLERFGRRVFRHFVERLIDYTPSTDSRLQRLLRGALVFELRTFRGLWRAGEPLDRAACNLFLSTFARHEAGLLLLMDKALEDTEPGRRSRMRVFAWVTALVLAVSCGAVMMQD